MLMHAVITFDLNIALYMRTDHNVAEETGVRCIGHKDSPEIYNSNGQSVVTSMF